MSCMAMQHLECAALGIEVGSAHPEEHTAAGELGIQEGYLIFPQIAPDQCADGPDAASRRDCRGNCRGPFLWRMLIVECEMLNELVA